MVTDSPGLGDAKLPLPQWIASFNNQLELNSRIDLCMIVIEKKERVDTPTVAAFTLLDQTMAALKPSNILIIFNKADLDEDSVNSVK
jgi:hypothetical protein